MARFKEEELRDVLFARAFEPQDQARAGLTRNEAESASREARAQLARAGETKNGTAFLVTRARLMCERLDQLYPRLGHWRAGTVWRGPAPWLVLVASVLLGLCVDRLGPPGVIDLLSFPILGLLLWNFGVYAFFLVSPLLRGRRRSRSEGATSRRAREGPLASALLWLGSPERFWRGSQSRADHGDFAVNAQRYLRDWLRVGAPLHLARVKLSLHLAACGVMVGAIGGMYLRGLVLHYEASWGSTFLSAETVHGMLAFIFTPVTGWLGQEVPDLATIESMASPEGSGPAAFWIHAWALTGLWAVILPRLLLALVTRAQIASVGRRMELDVEADAYFLRLMASDRGQGSLACVQTYSYQPNARSAEGLTTLLLDMLGGRTRVERLPSREYGEEPLIGDGAGQALCQVILFSLSQSAELEVHGKFLANTMDLLRRSPGSASLFVVLDEGPFLERLESGPDGERRLLERRRSWKRVLDDAGVQALSCHLDGWSDADILERARGVLLPLSQIESTP